MIALAQKLGFVIGESGEGPSVRRAMLALAED
jgi:hypothetical protein